jgi:GNAT superfamily N-acetyltransferase
MKLKFREAEPNDLEALVLLLAKDKLGSQREDLTLPINANYSAAFAHISEDPNNELLIAEFDGQLVGMLQLTYIPYLTYVGSWRCLIEGVRIDKMYRGQGFGKQMFEYAIEKARMRGCKLVQLTSDKQRPEAIRFYENVGFMATHEGLKLHF